MYTKHTLQVNKGSHPVFHGLKWWFFTFLLASILIHSTSLQMYIKYGLVVLIKQAILASVLCWCWAHSIFIWMWKLCISICRRGVGGMYEPSFLPDKKIPCFLAFNYVTRPSLHNEPKICQQRPWTCHWKVWTGLGYYQNATKARMLYHCRASSLPPSSKTCTLLLLKKFLHISLWVWGLWRHFSIKW